MLNVETHITGIFWPSKIGAQTVSAIVVNKILLSASEPLQRKKVSGNMIKILSRALIHVLRRLLQRNLITSEFSNSYAQNQQRWVD